MALIDITAENFKESVEAGGILLLDWWASWCGPCRAFAPVFEQAAKDHPDLSFGKIDTESQRELATMFEIRSIPTLMVFRDKVLLYAEPGALPAAALTDLIKQVRALDMEKVRQEIAAAQQNAPPQA